MKQLSPHDVRRLAVECHRCPDAIRNVVLGKAKPTVDRQVREAAARLGICFDAPLPDEPPAAA